jgi:hypothetical protein
MFKLFNKENKPRIIDRVFIHMENKWAYCQKISSQNLDKIFIGWFDDTITELENYFSATGTKSSILKARTTNKFQIESLPVVFIEHYPMKSKEQELLEQLGLKEAVFLTALDEPFLKYFGGEKLIKMMENLGMKKDEAIEHKLITQSIANAQEKIEAKVSIEQSARSQAEWMDRNLKKI